MDFNIGQSLLNLCRDSGIYGLIQDPKAVIMIVIACVLLYLGIKKEYEPLLLVPIAFGMLLTNLPFGDMYHEELFAGGHANWSLFGGNVLVNSNQLVLPQAGEDGVGGFIINSEGTIYYADTQKVFGHITDNLDDNYEYALDGDLNVFGTKKQDAAADLPETKVYEKASIIVELDNAYIGAEDKLVHAADGTVIANGGRVISAGLLDYLYLGVKLGIYPCLIFLGVGAMTDFGPLIANPKSLLMGAAAQLGIFMTFIVCYTVFGFTPQEAASTGIIGGADGPTAIYLTGKLAPHLLGPIAVAAYSYMALVPVIQPPIMRALTTKKEREIVMEQLRPVSKKEKIIFPIAVTIIVSLLLPSAAPLVGCLMLGNLFKESGVVERICKTAQNELMNIVTIFLGITVGATATANTFLKLQTIEIMCVGVVAFGCGTAGGILLAKLMNKLTGGKINPLIGSAGVSAVPMAARVSQVEGQKANPSNFLLMHAMGPNVAGVIGSAIAAGMLLSMFG